MSYLTQRSKNICIRLKRSGLHDLLQDWQCCLQHTYGRMLGCAVCILRAMPFKEAYQGGQIPKLLGEFLPRTCRQSTLTPYHAKIQVHC